MAEKIESSASFRPTSEDVLTGTSPTSKKKENGKQSWTPSPLPPSPTSSSKQNGGGPRKVLISSSDEKVRAERKNGTGLGNGAHWDRSKVDPRILEARKKLPIWIARETIVERVHEHDTVVVLGETGSGKTTQIPQFLFDAGLTGGAKGKKRQMIGITQPRRVAAISLAKRVAVEMGVPEPDKDTSALRRMRTSTNGSDRNGAITALVGYSVRFDDRSGKDTRIKFMTDGWLLRELLSGASKSNGKRKTDEVEDARGEADYEVGSRYSLLEQYSVIVIDEAHERSVHTDVVIGLIKRVQRERKTIRREWIRRRGENALSEAEMLDEPSELKVVVMSATIDAEAFAGFYSDEQGMPAPILYIKGRQFPLQLFHSEQSCTNWIEDCKKVMVQISFMDPGDVLVFMTGAEEIESFASELQELNRGLQTYAEGTGRPRPLELMVTKLYAALGGEAIRKCFTSTPPGHRKIVLATNIAETSITISGIKYVIDCGLAKERTFQSAMAADQSASNAIVGASVELLAVKSISKAAARQRAGRAGRESGGRCFRLFTEQAFETLPNSEVPEILRTDLCSVVLDVFAMGLNPLTFDWLDKPQDDDLRAAVISLTELGALEISSKSSTANQPPSRDLRLTTLGKEMSKLPLLPALSKTLLTARDLDDGGKVFLQALDLVAILSTERRTILVEPSNYSDDATKGSSTSKRDEADRARERFAHPSGDHATQLQAFHAFEEMETSCRAECEQDVGMAADVNGKARRSTKESPKLKEWCSVNFVSLKSIREMKRIRAQLLQACKRYGWIPDGVRGALNGQRRSLLAANGDDGDEESESDDGEGAMLVTRHANGSSYVDPDASSKEDYASLRRCLLQGKRLNTAFRQGQSGTYQRAHGGEMRFRIHPSSSLMLRATSEGGSSVQARFPTVIYFEDMTFTSQLFARTVSAVEASWLVDINAECRTRNGIAP